jgi:hypothetical protein
MKLAAFLAGCLISAPLCALEKKGPVITLTEQENALCDADGPCVVAPIGVLERLYAKAYAEGATSCHGRDRL